MAESNSIKEGFLCPICHKDMRSPNNLIAHFQDLHSEEQDVLKSIKDIYGKAKKKILKLDDNDLELFRKEMTFEKYYLEQSEPQETGPTRSHTDYFKSVRRERLDHRTTETNKLIIRLDRLLRVYRGSDRKQHEQELVSWLDGTNVTRCPSCTLSFNITRRQHHCRLCGSIMCNSCSFFLPYEKAQNIVAPVSTLASREGGSGKDTETLRICGHCLDMLESRRRVQAEQMRQPIVCQLYSHLQKNKNQVESAVEMYNKMYNSLISGETTYLLSDLQSLRTSIADQARMIDTLSKKIASMPTDEETPKSAVLQTAIRKATSVYIKDYLLTLPVPPLAQDLEKIRREYSLRSTEEDLVQAPRVAIKKVTVTTGWTPERVTGNGTSGEQDDPLLEQMNIVRSYINQARKAQRFEEVASLTENLNMLKEMYRKKGRDEGGEIRFALN